MTPANREPGLFAKNPQLRRSALALAGIEAHRQTPSAWLQWKRARQFGIGPSPVLSVACKFLAGPDPPGQAQGETAAKPKVTASSSLRRNWGVVACFISQSSARFALICKPWGTAGPFTSISEGLGYMLSFRARLRPDDHQSPRKTKRPAQYFARGERGA